MIEQAHGTHTTMMATSATAQIPRVMAEPVARRKRPLCVPRIVLLGAQNELCDGRPDFAMDPCERQYPRDSTGFIGMRSIKIRQLAREILSDTPARDNGGVGDG